MSGSITAIVGPNGSGKTLGAVALHATPSLAKGRPVAATIDLFYPGTKERHPNSILIERWRDLLELHDCTLILDEINSQFPSRGAMQLPPELLRLLHQLRKPRVDLVWTAVSWSRADVALREATKIVTTSTPYLIDKWQRVPEISTITNPSGRRIRDNQNRPLKLDSEWPPSRLFLYRDYDANAFDDFSIHVAKSVKPLRRRWYWRQWHHDQYAYDTLQQVPLLDNVSETGTCLNCGGQRTRPRCHCTEEQRQLIAPRTPQ